MTRGARAGRFGRRRVLRLTATTTRSDMANVTVPIFDAANDRVVLGRLTIDEGAATRLIDGAATTSFEYVRQEDGTARLLAVGVVAAADGDPAPAAPGVTVGPGR